MGYKKIFYEYCKEANKRQNILIYACLIAFFVGLVLIAMGHLTTGGLTDLIGLIILAVYRIETSQNKYFQTLVYIYVMTDKIDNPFEQDKVRSNVIIELIEKFEKTFVTNRETHKLAI